MVEPVTAIAVAAAKPLVSKLIEALIRPATAVLQGVSDPIKDIFGDRFEEYLNRQLVKHSYLPTIVFQVRQLLEDIYIPLTIYEDSSLDGGDNRVRVTLDSYDESFISAKQRVLITDSAGMGKSTLSRFLFIQAIKMAATVPIFIELRHLTADKSLLDHLTNELNPINADKGELIIDKRQTQRLLEKGVFTFFLDGYDEISSAHREKVTKDIKSFVESFASNRFLITSRPEHALASFPSFHAFKIFPLKKEEAFILIRKYDRNGEKGEKLIARLSDKSLPQVDEFLKNPLLTTLLYKAYDYKAQIPLKKANFYRQVFDALFEWHDLTKDGYSTRDKLCKLDIDGFHKILRALGFICILKSKVEADTDEVLNWIREAKTYAPDLKFAESDFLEDVIKAVPLFRREGNSILWSHKSLAEYFCSQFIVSDAKKDQERVCNHFAKSTDLPAYKNLLDLLYDMDIVLFGSYFIKPLLEFYESEKRRLELVFPSVASEKLQLRAAASFGTRPFVLNEVGKVVPSRTMERIKDISKAAASDWYGSEPDMHGDDTFDSRMQLGVGYYGSRRVYTLSHPMRTIMEILIIKKHPVVLLRSLYPPAMLKGEILGARDGQGYDINGSNSRVWNNERNFSNTTYALARSADGIINTEKISSTLRDIEQISGSSKTTDSLLNNLAKN